MLACAAALENLHVCRGSSRARNMQPVLRAEPASGEASSSMASRSKASAVVAALVSCPPVLRRARRTRRACAQNMRGDAWLEAKNFPRQLWDLTADEHQVLRDGGRVQKQAQLGNRGWGLVRINVRAPDHVVLRCLCNFGQYPDMMSAIRAAEVNSTSPAADAALVAKCTYRITRFWFEIPAVHHVDQRRGRISFDIDPDATGLVLREASGFWQVVPCRQNPGECRVVFRVYAHASKLMPEWLVEYGARKCLKRATSWLKPFAEKLWQESKQTVRAAA
mmetsp:Transcript_57948/g.119656  ORF Transcript_57948/g.119656 Transcript_57948/m.119656 type:complete len:278 (-) Transcript_57948:107-940(-)